MKIYIFPETLIDGCSEEKKAKDKKVCHKKKLKFEDYKNIGYKEAAKLQNKIYQQEKNKVNTEILSENYN